MPLIDVAQIFHAVQDIRKKAGLDEPPHSTTRIIDACFPNVL